MIRAFRNRLLGEHLGKEIAEVAAEYERAGTLIKTIESLIGVGRTVRPVELRVTPEMDALVPDTQLINNDLPRSIPTN